LHTCSAPTRTQIHKAYVQHTWMTPSNRALAHACARQSCAHTHLPLLPPRNCATSTLWDGAPLICRAQLLGQESLRQAAPAFGAARTLFERPAFSATHLWCLGPWPWKRTSVGPPLHLLPNIECPAPPPGSRAMQGHPWHETVLWPLLPDHALRPCIKATPGTK